MSRDDLSVLDKVTGKPRLLAEECATCIYRPGNLMHLRKGRLKEITEDARNNSFIICHSTLPGMSGEQAAVCRGFYDRFSTNLIRIYDRLGGWQEVTVDKPEGSG